MPQAFASNRKGRPFRSSGPSRQGGARPGFKGPGRGGAGNGQADKPEHEILFQTYFKSVGPRTYAAQVKKASNDNHYLVLTEGKRDEKTGEVRKTRLFVYSEDFPAFFRMLQETAHFIKDHPVPDEVKQKRDRFWAKKNAEGHAPAATKTAPAAPKAPPAPARAAAPPRPGR